MTQTPPACDGSGPNLAIGTASETRIEETPVVGEMAVTWRVGAGSVGGTVVILRYAFRE